MKKPAPIQINISSPCNEDWDKMSPNELGRFCSHCQKNVVDFTKWNDADLYTFFKNNKESVCGRLTVFQLNRDINITPQPNSRLYRIVIALGLTLITTQIPKANGKFKVPDVTSYPIITPDTIEKKAQDVNDTTGISGKVVDENNEPIIGAIVAVSCNGILKGGAQTNIDGNFKISPVDTGIYNVSITYIGYKRLTINNVVVTENKTINLTAKLESSGTMGTIGVIIIIDSPQLDPYEPNKTIYKSNQIDKSPY